jgi:hypothetical protein
MVPFAAALALLAAGAGGQPTSQCIPCHEIKTPGVVADWRLSRHAQKGITCEWCHGGLHQRDADFAKAVLPTPETCNKCHIAQVEEFKKGKHALAWASMKALPGFHRQPPVLSDGQSGCGGCHSLGIKTEAEVRELRGTSNGHGIASCDACHTRHSFSAKEARQPQACQTCHMGFDHPQWEMYSASKHGVRAGLVQAGVLPQATPAPTCQECHMPDGEHSVRTGWGFLGLRLPMSADPSWREDQTTILRALQLLDAGGQPTARMAAAKGVQLLRTTEESYQSERTRMLQICSRCHAANYAKAQLRRGDELLREADKLMAEAIRIVSGLYKDNLISRPREAVGAYPDLLTIHDATTRVEQRLFTMFHEHRMRTFQGAFHSNADAALWSGWTELRRDLTEIRAQEGELRERARSRAGRK